MEKELFPHALAAVYFRDLNDVIGGVLGNTNC
jgi:hypothetical protein